jgi:glucosamine--fructose-6-phosphate aminotransferase (isomerizing)
MSGDIIQSEIAEIPEVFSRIISNQKLFADAVALIKGRDINNVIIVARGTSAHAGIFLRTLIETEMGLPVGLASPSAVSINDAKLKFRNTLVIGISQSGQSPDLLSYLKASAEGGALIITMTNDVNSPMAKLAELHLDLQARTEKAVAATKSYSAQLLASLLLVRTWSGKFQNFSSISNQVSEILNRDEISDLLIKDINSRANLVFVGRGFALANSREGALKIQETSFRFTQGFSAADYIHGPIAAVDEKCTAIFLAPKANLIRGLEKAAIETRERSGKVIWLGSGGAAHSGEVVIQGCESEDEAFNCVVDATLIQILAVKLALNLGYNPDISRGLNKITLTD